jgi:hypothetical protein
MSIGASSNASEHFSGGMFDGNEGFPSGGLVNTQHFQVIHFFLPFSILIFHLFLLKQRVINVSNAPPVALKQSESGEWEIKQVVKFPLKENYLSVKIGLGRIGVLCGPYNVRKSGEHVACKFGNEC